MGYLNVTNITFDEGTSEINKPFSITIQFECLKALSDGNLISNLYKKEVEWKFIYVGHSHDVKHDQV